MIAPARPMRPGDRRAVQRAQYRRTFDIAAGVRHPLADAAVSDALARRATQIASAFAAIEPALRTIAPMQFESDFPARASAHARPMLGYDLPASALDVSWLRPLDVRALHAYCVIETFARLVDDAGTAPAPSDDDEPIETQIRRFGFHAVDLVACADGRLSGIGDHIIRVPRAIVTARTSYPGSMFPVEEALRRWEGVELHRYRDGLPNAAQQPTRYLKIGVYHFSSVDPTHGGCAAHGSDRERAAAALLERLGAFEDAVRVVHGCASGVATLLIGVDTDTDAVRVHVPDAGGDLRIDRFVDNADLYDRTRSLSRAAAKDAIRDAVALCAGTSPDDPATEGMRWFCGYLLKNNIGQIDAVRARYGDAYADRDHSEALIVIGDGIDDVQLRNLAFTVALDSVEAGGTDLDIGMRILAATHEPRDLAVPVLAHVRYDERIPGARERARERSRRLRDAALERYPREAAGGRVVVRAFVRAGDAAPLEAADA